VEERSQIVSPTLCFGDLVVDSLPDIVEAGFEVLIRLL
jgi:hypothetical protein